MILAAWEAVEIIPGTRVIRFENPGENNINPSAFRACEASGGPGALSGQRRKRNSPGGVAAKAVFLCTPGKYFVCWKHCRKSSYGKRECIGGGDYGGIEGGGCMGICKVSPYLPDISAHSSPRHFADERLQSKSYLDLFKLLLSILVGIPAFIYQLVKTILAQNKMNKLK